MEGTETCAALYGGGVFPNWSMAADTLPGDGAGEGGVLVFLLTHTRVLVLARGVISGMGM